MQKDYIDYVCLNTKILNYCNLPIIYLRKKLIKEKRSDLHSDLNFPC